MDSYITEINKRVVAQICLTVGWHTIKPSALSLLTDILHWYLQKLAVSILRRSEHCSRTVPVLEDLESVFEELNISWSGLQEYVENVPPVPCPVRVPKFPIQCESHLNFLRPGSQEVITRPIHIYEHLPTMHLQLEEKESIKESHAGRKSQIETPPNSSPECSVFKRPRHTTKLGSPSMSLNEESSPLRELSSVMMTTSGFLSPAREGKLPNSHFNTKSGPSYPTVPPELKDKHSFMISGFNTNQEEETANKIYYHEPNSCIVIDPSQETSIFNEKYVKPDKQKLSKFIKTKEFNESNVYTEEQGKIVESVQREESLSKIGETIEAVIHQHHTKSVDIEDMTGQQEYIKTNESSTDCNILRQRLQSSPLGISYIPNNPEISFKREQKLNKTKWPSNLRDNKSPMQFNINSQELHILNKPHLVMNQELNHPMFESQHSQIHRTHSALPYASLPPTRLMHSRFPKNQPLMSGKSISCATTSKSSIATFTSSKKQLLMCSEQNLHQDFFKDKTNDQKKWKAIKKCKDEASDNKIKIITNNMIEKKKGSSKIKIKDKYKPKKRNKGAKNDTEEQHFDGDELQFRFQNNRKITNRTIVNKPDLKNCSEFVKSVRICSSTKQKFQISDIITRVEMKDLTKDFRREMEPVHEASYIDNDGMQVWICPACDRRDNGSPMIGCDGCDAWYHWTCVGIKDPPDSSDWFCRVCNDK